MRRDVYQAIADQTRRDIINLLAKESLNLNTLADNFQISRSAVSQQVKILAECGLVIIRQEGRERYCEARLQSLSQVSNWLEQYRQLWEERLDVMENLVEELETRRKKNKPSARTRKK